MDSRAVALASFLLLAPSTSRADGFPAQALRLAPVGRGSVSIESADTLAPLDLEGSAQLSWAQHPVELRAGGQRVGGVIDALSALDLRIALGLPAGLEVGAVVPLLLDRQTADRYDGMGGAGLGDVGVGLKWSAVPRGRHALGLALVTTLTAPTGDPEMLAGTGRFGGELAAIGEAGAGPLRALVLAGARLHAGDVAWQGARVGQQAIFGAALELAPDARRTLRFGAELAGAVSLERAVDAPMEALASARWSPGALTLSAAGGAGLTSALGTPDFRILVGVGVTRGRGGRDGDGDGDGVPDATDRCPTAAEDEDGVQDADGCPDVDDDGDGVTDAADRCPSRAEDQDGFEDADGCPDDDNDRDRIADAADACRNDAEDRDGHEDRDGCPDHDDDGDGIADTADRCRLQPETQNGFEEADGCPDVAPPFVFRPRERIVFNDIAFQTGSAELLPSALPILDQIVTSLQAQPDVRVRIEGHTDDRGRVDRNLALSQRRALAVVNYLIGGGVDARRLEHQGFGDTRPIESNATEAGRARNRRVEVVTLDR